MYSEYIILEPLLHNRHSAYRECGVFTNVNVSTNANLNEENPLLKVRMCDPVVANNMFFVVGEQFAPQQTSIANYLRH